MLMIYTFCLLNMNSIQVLVNHVFMDKIFFLSEKYYETTDNNIREVRCSLQQDAIEGYTNAMEPLASAAILQRVLDKLCN